MFITLFCGAFCVLCILSWQLVSLKLTAILGMSAFLFISWIRDPIPEVPQTDQQKKKKFVANEKYHPSKVPDRVDAIVIGSGMSGLSCAAILSQMGQKVVVLEQHETDAGGGTHMFSYKGCQFDSGLHYVVPYSEQLLHLAAGGPKPPVKFELMGEPDGTFDKIILGDDEPFCYKHKEAHLKDIYKLFPEEKTTIDEYLELSTKAMKCFPVYAISKMFPFWFRKHIFAPLFLQNFRKYAGRTAKEVLTELTKNNKLISLLLGLWIDTGTPPTRCSFMLAACVGRGLSIEGGAYPNGGSAAMAEALIRTVIGHGGSVLVNAKIDQILTNPDHTKVTGVRMARGSTISTKCVISSAGYRNTFGKLLVPEVTSKHGIPRTLPVPQSPGFVMCNVAIHGDPKKLNIGCYNTWVHPVCEENDWDMFKVTQDSLDNPLEVDLPAMITFPSFKDREWLSKHPGKISCQVLVMAEVESFRKWEDRPSGNRGEDYEKVKKLWEEKCLNILLKYYPQVKDYIEFVDVSTPLSIEHYLASPGGGAVGLDLIPERFTNWDIQKHLEMTTPVGGLFMTGQDTLLCGVPIVQLTGVMTALKVGGWWRSTRFVLEATRRGLKKLISG